VPQSAGKTAKAKQAKAKQAKQTKDKKVAGVAAAKTATGRRPAPSATSASTTKVQQRVGSGNSPGGKKVLPIQKHPDHVNAPG